MPSASFRCKKKKCVHVNVRLLQDYFPRHVPSNRMQNIVFPIPDSQENNPKKMRISQAARVISVVGVSEATDTLFEQGRLVNQRCPRNKTLLRKHHHQSQQRVCWRRRQDDGKSRYLHINSQFPIVRGGPRSDVLS